MDMDRKRVGVLMGGPSNERHISIKSGKAVCRALVNKGLEVVPLELEESLTMNGYRDRVRQKIQGSNIEVAFIALHGRFGEDGAIQSMLEDMRVPYTGSNAHASEQSMDKIASKDLFRTNSIPTPTHKVFFKDEASCNIGLDNCLNEQVYFKELGLPLVVKPSNEGSSIGLSIVDNKSNFFEALNSSFKYSNKVIIEQYIPGREITVGILEDKPLPVVEILPKKRFFDFEAKYQKGFTEYKVPAEIEKDTYKRCQDVALGAHKAVGARFFSRVDMILSAENKPLVLEVNTIPGLTEMSLLPKAAQAAGIDFDQLILKILESALWLN